MSGYDIILVNPKLWEREFRPPTQPPFGLLMISHLLKEAGYNIYVYDQRLESSGKAQIKHFIKNVKRSSPLFFGFSVQSGPPIMHALRISEMIKQECPDTPIAWGGVHPTLLPEQTLGHPLVDMVIKGEGEMTTLELAKSLEKGRPLSSVKGLFYKNEGSIKGTAPRKPIDDLDKIDIRWDLVNPEDYIREIDGRKTLSTITSRGCPFRCGFCFNQQFYRRGIWKSWSVEKTIEEIRRLLGWGVERIRFEDDNILINKKQIVKLAENISNEKLSFEWIAPARANILDNEFASLISRAGCRAVTIGAESGSQKMLDIMHKDSRVEHLYSATKNLKENRIEGNYSWIFGYPGEEKEDLMKTVKAIKTIEKIYPETKHMVNIFSPYPGTDGYELAIENGFVPPRNLESWERNFREQCNHLTYIKNRELKRQMETIRWVVIFRSMGKRRDAYTGSVKMVLPVIAALSNFRWKRNLYGFPVEISLIEKSKKFAF